MKIKYNIQIKNLFIYLISFYIICILLVFIVIFFSNNIKSYSNKLSTSNDYTMLNLYFLNTVNENGLLIENYGLVDSEDINSYFISFIGNDGNKRVFIKQGTNIYYNNIKICENVDEFKVIVDKSYKQVINVKLKIDNSEYNMQYSLNN